MDTCILIYTTCKNKEEAKSIGKNLVQEKIVACVNILDRMESIYVWNSELVEDSETILISKTVESNFKYAEQRIKQLHSYTNPCIVSISIQEGSQEYLQWIHDSVDH